jgi:hypothetical protein
MMACALAQPAQQNVSLPAWRSRSPQCAQSRAVPAGAAGAKSATSVI